MTAEPCPECNGTGRGKPIIENIYWLNPDFTRKVVRRDVVGFEDCLTCDGLGTKPRTDGHEIHVCPGGHEHPGCMFCDGGLGACDRCNAFEGAWPDNCPPVPMDLLTSDLVYAGRLNYRDGWWRAECCRVMRPVHDREAYLLEQGYEPAPAGGWRRKL